MAVVGQMINRVRKSEIGSLRILLIGLFVLAIPVALITTTIRVAISEPALYDYSVKQYDAERVSGIPESELLRANQEIREYLVEGGSGPLAIQVTNQANETGPLFNAKETIHMADVRNLVQLMFTVQVIAVALALSLAVVMVVLWPGRALAAAMLWGSLLTLLLLGMVGGLAVMAFDAAWSRFHGIVFTNNFWELNPRTDHLIQMFPEAFWQEAVAVIGLFIVLQAIAIGALSGTYLFLTRPRGDVIEARPRPDLPLGEGPRHQRLAPPNPRHYVQ